MLRFDDWIVKIYENLDSREVETLVKEVEKALEPEMGTLYSVPNFRTIHRSNEPIQYTILFTNDKFHTFTLNFTKDKNLYSVDFWKKDSSSPTLTLYSNGNSMRKLLRYIPYIAPAPHKDLDIEKVKKHVARNHKAMEPITEEFQEGSEDISLQNSKPFNELETPEEVKAKKKIGKAGYAFGDPKTIFKDLVNYVNLVIDGQQPGLVVTGQPGVGKTYVITKTVLSRGLVKGKDWVKIKGKSTAAALYVTMYQQNGKLIIFDDCDSIFKDENAVNILKGALDTEEKQINWNVQGKGIKAPDGTPIPLEFEFSGKVIFITNLNQQAIDDAIKSRNFVLEVALSPEDMIAKIKQEMPHIMPDVKMEMKEYALDTMLDVVKSNPDVEINMRTFIKAIKILINIKDSDDAERMIVQQCSYK